MGLVALATGEALAGPCESCTPSSQRLAVTLETVRRSTDRIAVVVLGGDTNQWFPELVYDNPSVEQPKQPEEGYHLSIDLADKAIEFIQDAHINAPDKPFFLYYPTGAGHAPHHAPAEWADKYKGKFDMGWDKYREIVHQCQHGAQVLMGSSAYTSPWSSTRRQGS